jgi:superfamily II DNA or RNA helicase
MLPEHLKPNAIIRGPLFPEPVQVVAALHLGGNVKLNGYGLKTGQAYNRILTTEQVALLEVSPEAEPFDGDPKRFQLGIEALRLGWAYEYDPYFSLSIARVDPLPHQLEAVYDYFLKVPRIRFLLADDPGAGKTIMAGLLIKELKVRGLVKRILIVTPANLTFQWQRELKDKFREKFDVVRGDVLRANYGSNPWQEKDQVITSVSWVSTIDDAKDSLLRSQWDLIIVDEAHKMSAYSREKKTLAYKLGESLSELTDHFLLMTATPHKGNAEHFSLFLELLDKDIYGDISSLEEAIKRREAPFYLRRVKEAMVTFPDPETGQVKCLFTKRNVQTIPFDLNPDEYDFYRELTEFVEDQSIKAASEDSARGRALGFTMAMLQRRFASSVCAVRKSLERMRTKREEILKDPEAYRLKQIERKLPEDFDERSDEEQQGIMDELEGTVASFDPAVLREEIQRLGELVDYARRLEAMGVESKLRKLRETLEERAVFGDPKMKLLLFTEHKDTLDYLVERLRAWGLTVTQIHGGMKVGDRDTPGTRIYAEREFRETCQVLVATEAAGEGINLQFCWYLINYDIPWNPMRLEQRMGRIHRYGQEKDCLIHNFVSVKTREGRVMEKLFERLATIEADLDPQQTGKVFNVLGDIFPANELERMVRDLYTRNQTEQVILDRIQVEVDTQRFRRITHSTLEGLAKRELNLGAIVGKTAEAKERRLVPEVVRDFFLQAAPILGLQVRELPKEQGVFRLPKIPQNLLAVGVRQEPRFGRLGKEYPRVAFDKEVLKKDATLDWVTPGHPLFEALREDLWESSTDHLRRGALFYELNREQPARLDVFSAAIQDGCGHVLHRRLFVVVATPGEPLRIAQPTLFLDFQMAPQGTPVPSSAGLPERGELEMALYTEALQPFLAEAQAERTREVKVIEEHLDISLNALILKANLKFGELHEQLASGTGEAGLEGRLAQAEHRIQELNLRLEKRQGELAQERHCTIGDIQHQGTAWVLPHPERQAPEFAPLVKDDEIERIAVEAVIAYEAAQGRTVQTVESENRGFDLISRRPHPEDPQTAIEVRFIEVKGRSGVGEVALTSNEFRTAKRLGQDYWLYVVFNCATTPEVHVVRDPHRLDWEELVKVVHYKFAPKQIQGASE